MNWYGVYFEMDGPEVWHVGGYYRVRSRSRKQAGELVERVLRKRYSAHSVRLTYGKCKPQWQWLERHNG